VAPKVETMTLEHLHEGEHSKILYDKKKNILRKYPTRHLELGVLYREAYWTWQFYLGGVIDRDGSLVRSSLGEPLTAENLPGNLDVQIYRILLALAEKNCRHNNIQPDNLLVDRKRQLKLIDFAWATWTDEEIPSTWPSDLGSGFKGPDGFSDEYSLRASLDCVAGQVG